LIQAQLGKDSQSTLEFLAKSKTVASVHRREDPYMNNSLEKMSKQDRVSILTTDHRSK